jgi:hypothetical protein
MKKDDEDRSTPVLPPVQPLPRNSFSTQSRGWGEVKSHTSIEAPSQTITQSEARSSEWNRVKRKFKTSKPRSKSSKKVNKNNIFIGKLNAREKDRVVAIAKRSIALSSTKDKPETVRIAAYPILTERRGNTIVKFQYPQDAKIMIKIAKGKFKLSNGNKIGLYYANY